LFNVIGQISGQLVNPKKTAVKGPSNDFSVIISLLTSLRENDEPLNDATYSSFLSSIDKKTGNIINKKITKQPAIIVIDVFNFIIDKLTSSDYINFMSNLIKKLFGTLIQKPWEKERIAIDTAHSGKTFDISLQKSAVIIIFGIATVLFSLVFTSYLYSLPPGQDTNYLLRPNLLWINTLILFSVTYFFGKISNDLEKKQTLKIKKNLLIVGVLSYLFLFGQVIFWFQLMKSGNYVSTNSYFSSFYVFTAIHGMHLLGGLFFWGRVSSRALKLKQNKILEEEKNISALSLYWKYLLVVWIMFFLMIYIFNDAVIAWCKSIIS